MTATIRTFDKPTWAQFMAEIASVFGEVANTPSFSPTGQVGSLSCQFKWCDWDVTVQATGPWKPDMPAGTNWTVRVLPSIMSHTDQLLSRALCTALDVARQDVECQIMSLHKRLDQCSAVIQSLKSDDA